MIFLFLDYCIFTYTFHSDLHLFSFAIIIEIIHINFYSLRQSQHNKMVHVIFLLNTMKIWFLTSNLNLKVQRIMIIVKWSHIKRIKRNENRGKSKKGQRVDKTCDGTMLKFYTIYYIRVFAFAFVCAYRYGARTCSHVLF